MELLVAIFGRGGALGASEEGEGGVSKVVVAEGVGAGADLAREAHGGDELHLGGLAGVVDVGEGGRAAGCDRVEGVVEYELWGAAGVVGDGEGDAGFGEEGREEVVVGDAVLDLSLG
ncbi:MAG: hypothetical protein R3B70_44775 [Polyangiaceae bacterium]